MKMDTKKAENLVMLVFEKINKSKSSNCLIDLLKMKELIKNKLDTKKYPKINFTISNDELKKLSEIGYLANSKLNVNSIDFEKESTLVKLLYSILWKNGDLGKEKHIICGINNESKGDNKAIVFYHFGKYLADSLRSKPIIDQHTLRAFGVYLCVTNQIQKVEKKIRNNKSKIILTTEYYLKLNTASFREIPLVDEYEEWIKSHHLNIEDDFVYNLDLVLFALGKTIKYKK